MSTSNEPLRWRDGTDEWAELSRGLTERAGTGPSAEAEARILAQLANLDAATLEPSAAPAKLASLAPRKLLWVGLAMLVGLAALYQLTRGPAQRSQPVPVSSDVPAELAPEPHELPPKDEAHEPSPPEAQEEAPSGELPSARPTRERRPRAARANEAREPESAADPVAELALLTRARRILLSDPARALSLVAEHEKLYRRGQFVEEREVIAIEALIRTGEQAAAQRRGRAFLAAHPQSAHGVRVRELLTRAH